MATRILLAPVGAGKTEHVLNQITRTLNTQPFARIWCVLATKRQEDAFRQRLIDWDTGKRAFFNVEFFNFYELYTFLLDMAGNPQRQLAESARLALLRSVITDVEDQLQSFHKISHTPGFLRIIADFIYELKQNRIYPEDFAMYAETTISKKDDDLALIYGQYQAKLQRYNLVDKEGQGWLAVEALRGNIDLAGDLSLFIVDGFDQFTPVQADLVTLLADRAETGLITMTRVPGREATVGRRFERALERLMERFGESLLDVQENLSITDGRQADLQHLIDQVFRREPLQQPLSSGVQMAEVPNIADEVGWVSRRVKQLLLDGVDADEIIVVLRDWERYRSHFVTMRDKYQLPIVLHYGEPLEENPAVTVLIDLLTLHESDFRRRELLHVLRSPYFNWPTLTNTEINLLDQISQQYSVVRGKSAWMSAIHQASQQSINIDGEVIEGLLSEDAAEQLQSDLNDFFAIVTPFDEATISEYAYWVDALLGTDPNADQDDDILIDGVAVPSNSLTLDMIRCVRSKNAPDEIIARDVMALHEFKQVLRGMLTAQELLRSLDGRAEPLTDWATFSSDLLSAVGSAAVSPRPTRYGRVLVTTAADARGLPHNYVFVLGLSEGIFPAATSEDPLYLDSERRNMRLGTTMLETQAERAADDGLFYELICLPRKMLTLTRPTMQDGKPWMPSPLWRGVKAVFSDADAQIRQQSIRIGQVIAAEAAATLDEAAVAVVDAMGSNEQPTVMGVKAWLQSAHTAYWGRIRRGRDIEANRLSMMPYDRYSGRLQDARLIAHVQALLGPNYKWSASKFNDYGVCGFRFFAKRLLNLEPLEEPEEGMDAAQHGSLNHTILEKTYREVQNRALMITPDNLDVALEIFNAAADNVLANAPDAFGFRADALWQQEQRVIRRKLEQIIRKDFAKSDDNPIVKKFEDAPRKPYMLEAPFGMDKSDPVTIDLGEDIGEVRVLGFIDRIDQQGNSLLVIDYKSGSTGIPTKEMTEGRNFQMLVYLEGVQALVAEKDPSLHVSGGAFWHINKQSLSGAIHLDDVGITDINRAKTHLARNIALGREGDFAVHANAPDSGRCVRYCEFSQLCRMSSTHRQKKN